MDFDVQEELKKIAVKLRDDTMSPAQQCQAELLIKCLDMISKRHDAIWKQQGKTEPEAHATLHPAVEKALAKQKGNS